MTNYAVSDIHGCDKSFEALLDRLAFSLSDTLYILGDYVDRGPNSKGVIDRIWNLQAKGYNIHCLKGNHEELVLQAAFGDTTLMERWLKTDGKDTMDSFGVTKCSDIPSRYLEWMTALPYFFCVDEYILVHGGLDFSLDDPLSDVREMCWMRGWHHQIRYDWLAERCIIHGHTPMEQGEIKAQLSRLNDKKYLDIDNGCVYGDPRHWKENGLGHLCAFDMHNRTLLFQEYIDLL